MEQVKCKSGIMGWQCKLQENYDNSFEQFQSWCETHNIHTRLGYKTPESAWKNNPIIQGSTEPSDLRKVSITELLIPEVSGKYGAPIGRHDTDERETETVNGTLMAKFNGKVFDRAVPMSDGAYDKGGAYWGIGAQLRVSYTKDLKYIHFYRKGEK